MAKKKVKKPQKKSAPIQKRTIPIKQITSRYNSRRALKDLILFTVSGNTLYQDTFYLLAILFGFIAVAFLIVFLVIVFAREKVKQK